MFHSDSQQTGPHYERFETAFLQSSFNSEHSAGFLPPTNGVFCCFFSSSLFFLVLEQFVEKYKNKNKSMQLVIEELINVLHSWVTQIYIYIFMQRHIEEIQKYLCGQNKVSQQDTGVIFPSIFFSLLPCYDVFLMYFSNFPVFFFFDLSKNTMA